MLAQHLSWHTAHSQYVTKMLVIVRMVGAGLNAYTTFRSFVMSRREKHKRSALLHTSERGFSRGDDGDVPGQMRLGLAMSTMLSPNARRPRGVSLVST
jgi:hypothetical protein